MAIFSTPPLLIAGLASFAAAPEGSHAYLEIAIYKVHDGQSFSKVREATVSNLSKEPGFLVWHRLVEDEGSLYADVLAWSSAPEAKAAAEKVRASETYATFVTAIREIVHFGHYLAAAEQTTLAGWLDTSPLIEIALYQVKDSEIHERSRVGVYEQLPKRPGMLGGTYLSAAEGSDGYGDLLTWQTREDFEKTGTDMQAMPEHAPFFSGVADVHVFTHFRRDPAAHSPSP